jgi:hypothetical protein
LLVEFCAEALLAGAATLKLQKFNDFKLNVKGDLKKNNENQEG